MHAVALHKETIKQNPWLPRAVFDAYSQSKQAAFDYMKNYGWVKESLPWFGQEFEETKAAMGENYWPYGIAPNRKALETLFQYSYEQGLASKQLSLTRADFAQRLQEIIDRYNSGGSSTENYYDDLLNFAKELRKEDERHLREGLSIDDAGAL